MKYFDLSLDPQSIFMDDIRDFNIKLCNLKLDME